MKEDGSNSVFLDQASQDRQSVLMRDKRLQQIMPKTSVEKPVSASFQDIFNSKKENSKSLNTNFRASQVPRRTINDGVNGKYKVRCGLLTR